MYKQLTNKLQWHRHSLLINYIFIAILILSYTYTLTCPGPPLWRREPLNSPDKEALSLPLPLSLSRSPLTSYRFTGQQNAHPYPFPMPPCGDGVGGGGGDGRKLSHLHGPCNMDTASTPSYINILGLNNIDAPLPMCVCVCSLWHTWDFP